MKTQLLTGCVLAMVLATVMGCSDNSPVAEAGDRVKVHYTGTLENGEKFDSSRDRDEPLAFTVGAGEMISGFDKGIRGMKVGETKQLRLPPEEAYGPLNPQATMTIERKQLGAIAEKVKLGDKLVMQTNQGPKRVRVTQVTDDTVTLDANHELAGKTLLFDVELVELTKAK